MKREHFTLTIALPEDDSGDRPSLEIEYDGPTEWLREQLQTTAGTPVDATDLDVAFRLIDDETGVLSIADRYTGAFVCELQADADAIEAVVAAAEDDDERYRVAIATDAETRRYEKQTLLVYDADGQLLRTASLIPGSVEL